MAVAYRGVPVNARVARLGGIEMDELREASLKNDADSDKQISPISATKPANLYRRSERSHLLVQLNRMTIRNFVFSSVGDNTTFHTLFAGNNMTYDLHVIYYGDNDDNYNTYKSTVNSIEKRNGSKFQNFKYFHDTYPDIIKQYNYFFILDDDILINVEDINKMFKIADDYKLSICGPSFLSAGLISHRITIHKPDVLLTYTNFVEVNTPLFSYEALTKFMDVLCAELIGWGIDYLYIWTNGIDKDKDYAIIHNIKCVNPQIENKLLNRRELTLVDGCDSRRDIWIKYATKIGCPIKYDVVEYSEIAVMASSE